MNEMLSLEALTLIFLSHWPLVVLLKAMPDTIQADEFRATSMERFIGALQQPHVSFCGRPGLNFDTGRLAILACVGISDRATRFGTMSGQAMQRGGKSVVSKRCCCWQYGVGSEEENGREDWAAKSSSNNLRSMCAQFVTGRFCTSTFANCVHYEVKSRMLPPLRS